jgi:carbonic anhydrase
VTLHPAPTRPDTDLSRRGFLKKSALVGAGLSAGAFALSACGDSGESAKRGGTENMADLTPDQALQKLKDGNARFVAMKGVDPNLSSERRVAVAAGQNPFAGIIGCVDSRVPPELVFDRGLGDLFVGRVAAAIADDSQVGSMEFGVSEFNIPLLVVLGHEKCGAVKATIEATEHNQTVAPGQIGAVVGPIIPAVKNAESNHGRGGDLLDLAVRESVKLSTAALRTSPVLSGLISGGKLRVVGARYDLASGRVEFID